MGVNNDQVSGEGLGSEATVNCSLKFIYLLA